MAVTEDLGTDLSTYMVAHDLSVPADLMSSPDACGYCLHVLHINIK